MEESKVFNETEKKKIKETQISLFVNTLDADLSLLRSMSYGWAYSTPELIELYKKKIQTTLAVINEWTEVISSFAFE